MPNPLDIVGELIECVDHLKYLGSTKTDSTDRSKGVNARLRMAKKRLQISITSEKTAM